MITSVMKLHDSNKDVLNKPPNTSHKECLLKLHETLVLEELIDLLEPIFYITLLLGGSKYVSCSVILHSVTKLIEYFSSFKSASTNITINSMAKIIKESLVKRTKEYFEIDELYAASYLDPRFRSFFFVLIKTW